MRLHPMPLVAGPCPRGSMDRQIHSMDRHIHNMDRHIHSIDRHIYVHTHQD